MSKQTAVQWLVNEYAKAFKIPINSVMLEIIEQALQMEREQIEEAYGDGLNAHRVDFCNRNEYYQKTYGGQDE
jgi:hypothetical protein